MRAFFSSVAVFDPDAALDAARSLVAVVSKPCNLKLLVGASVLQQWFQLSLRYFFRWQKEILSDGFFKR